MSDGGVSDGGTGGGGPGGGGAGDGGGDGGSRSTAGGGLGVSSGASGSRVDAMLAAARARLDRLTPDDAAAAVAAGAILIDIRPAAQRAAEGAIPAAVIIERNVLEWRLDPTCEARAAFATGDDIRPIIICSEGYTSSLAAAALLDLQLTAATDVIGGFHAWAAAGLPITRG